MAPNDNPAMDQNGSITPIETYDWPGEDNNTTDGFEVNHQELQTMANRFMVDLNTVEMKEVGSFHGALEHKGGTWEGALMAETVIDTFTIGLFAITSDAMVECTVAACGVATSGQNYNIAEDHSWLTGKSRWDMNQYLDFVSPGGYLSHWDDKEKSYRLSSEYPVDKLEVSKSDTQIKYNSSNSFETGKWSEYGSFSKEFVRSLIMAYKENLLLDYSKMMEGIANELDTVKGKLRTLATDASRAWHGPAEVKAQQALKKIYEGIGPLVTAYHTMSSLTRTWAEDILVPAQTRFDHVVTSENWFTDIFQDDDDESARRFLKDLDRQLADKVLKNIPRSVRLDLPGLVRPEDRQH
ncbi:hypothetical protein [Actinoallomurus iriomotensis]|uniref:Uncharacterized protein n=1 Tax=Actinoallomurus iriomotensis TaxID=478107 RepID=A0A9W6SD90_9ACTN|nr:hypothetical protein [Actinoallomurus iriomotensis]GLY91471.1 hypothetical protein Airi02_094000 [Actinoallomurus iriomotensis]